MNLLLTNIINALESLKANKLRSSLTLLGVMIGVAAMIAVVGIGEASRQKVVREIEKIGADLLWVNVDYSFSKSQQRTSYRFVFDAIRENDITAIEKLCPALRSVAPVGQSEASVRYMNRELELSLIGTTSTYLNIHRLNLIRGRFFSPFDKVSKHRVCVIEEGDSTRRLFGLVNPVGEKILLNGKEFEVVGMVEEKKIMGTGMKGNIYLPISVIDKGSYAERKIDFIYAQAASSSLVKEASDQIERILTQRHRKRGTKFVVRSLTDTLKSAQKIRRTFTLIVSGIATISLLVGGIGIMNIMLVSVTERTREIGLRKAVGARIKDIFLQFLAEAVILSSLGGVLGIIMGITTTYFAAPFWNVSPTVPLWGILIGFSFSVVTGILAGMHPAIRAANLNPIEALRYE